MDHQVQARVNEPYRAVELGRPALLGRLQKCVSYIPYPAPMTHFMSNYYAMDLTSLAQVSDHWMFFGQLKTELHPCQLAKVCMAAMGIDPLIVTKTNNNCMCANLRSQRDMNVALDFKRRMLLDYEGVWLALSTDGEVALQDELNNHQPTHLPHCCVTIALCLSPPQYLVIPGRSGLDNRIGAVARYDGAAQQGNHLMPPLPLHQGRTGSRTSSRGPSPGGSLGGMSSSYEGSGRAHSSFGSQGM